MDKRIKKAILIIGIVVLTNLGLTFGKLYVGLATNSICVLLDATNSFFDIITGIVTIVAFITLLKPHKYGYGRAEYLATFVVAVVSLAFGGLFAYRSIGRISMPEPVRSSYVSILIVALAIPIKLGLALLVKFSNRKINSSAFKALALDSFLDVGVTVASLLSFTLSAELGYTIDAFFGLGVSIFIIVATVKLLIEYTKKMLVGEDNTQTADNLKQLILSLDGIKQVGEINLHDYGYGKTIADVQVQFDGEPDYASLCEKSQSISEKILEEMQIKANIIPFNGGLENE